jgi:hypothetical protein
MLILDNKLTQASMIQFIMLFGNVPKTPPAIPSTLVADLRRGVITLWDWLWQLRSAGVLNAYFIAFFQCDIGFLKTASVV